MKCIDNKKGIFAVAGFTLVPIFLVIIASEINGDTKESTSNSTSSNSNTSNTEDNLLTKMVKVNNCQVVDDNITI